MRILISILLVSISMSLSAQNYFNRTFGEGDSSMNSGKIIETPDGFIIFGFTVEMDEKVFYAKKLNIEGEEVFTKNLLVGDVWGWERPHNCIATTDGNFVLSINERVESGDFETVLFKINSEADILWTRRFTVSNGISYDVIGQISETSDLGYLITGASNYIESDFNPIDDSKTLVIKTDNDGELEWMQLIEEPLFTEEDINRAYLCFSHLEMPNGNFLLACTSCETEPGTAISCIAGTSINVLTQLTASTGEVLEEQVLDDYYYQSYPLIVPIDEEHFILNQTGPVDDFTTFRNSWIISKYNYDGELIWEHYYTNDIEDPYFYGNRSTLNTLPIVRENGSFVSIFNHTDGYQDENGLWILGTGSSLALFNPEGEWENTITLGKDTTAAYVDGMFDIERTNDGGYALAGITHPKNQSYASKAWVVKIDSSFNQCVGSPCDSILVNAPLQVIDVGSEELANANSIYPNPANELLNLALNKPIKGEAHLYLRHLTGELVRSFKLSGQHSLEQFDISGIRNGFYVWELVQQDLLLQTGKLVIE